MHRKDNNKHVTRRTFVGAAAGLAAAGVIAGKALSAVASSSVSSSEALITTPTAATAGNTLVSGKVVSVHSTAAFKGKELDADVVSKMLAAGMLTLGGGVDANLWVSLFRPEDIVGIKLNCISRTVRPNKPLIDAVVAGLTSAGVKENNIIVWDRFEDQLERRARLKINRGAEGVRVYGTERSGDNLSGYDDTVFYDTDKDTPEYRGSSGTRSLVTRILTADCTKIINMPVLKDHNQAGITACLKNLAFGAVNNTARFHKAPMYCSPAISDIMLIPCIRQKAVLHVLDALRVCYNGGPDVPNPAYVANASTIFLSTDPVACDTIALDVVQRMRADAGLPDLYQTSGQPVHITDAAEKGLGTGDRAAINLVAVEV